MQSLSLEMMKPVLNIVFSIFIFAIWITPEYCVGQEPIRYLKSLRGLKIKDITVIGVSKGKQRKAGKEKIHFASLKEYLPKSNKNINFSNPLILDKNDPILYYIQRLRDEAHRFAISSQRNKQKSLIKKSILSEIPSIGAKRKKILLMHFSSIKQISEAPLNELNKISGISLKSAEEIYNFFQSIKN